MVALAVLGILFILAGLFVCTNKVDEYWSNRAPRMGTVVIQPRPIRLWTGTCTDCHTEDQPDMWLPHLCYECAELQRVRKRNGQK